MYKTFNLIARNFTYITIILREHFALVLFQHIYLFEHIRYIKQKIKKSR